MPLGKGVLAVEVGREGSGGRKPPGWGLEDGEVDDIDCVLDRERIGGLHLEGEVELRRMVVSDDLGFW